MNSRKVFQSALALSIFGVLLLTSSTGLHSNQTLNLREQGMKLDQSGRIVESPAKGKINYPEEKPKIQNPSQKNSGAQLSTLRIPPEDYLVPVERYLSIQAGNLSLKEDWRVGIFGSGIGKSGIITLDLDADGVTEIICAGSTYTFGQDNFWYVLEYSQNSGLYAMRWISDLYSQGITSIAAFKPKCYIAYNLFFALSNGDILVYDGINLQEFKHIDTPAITIRRILIADSDNDSKEEINFCDDQNLYIFNLLTLTLKSKIPYGASDFEVGNVDADSLNEIVFANGKVLEFDGDTARMEWNYAAGGFGRLVELSDIDSDNMKEILAASSWTYITCFDADLKSLKWQILTAIDIGAFRVADVDANGIEEVLYGDGQWGMIHCYDPVSLTEKWWIRNPEHGVTDIAVFDTDEDGELEVLWGAGATSTGPDYLYVHGMPPKGLEWQSQHIDGPFHAVDVGDVDSDGQQEIVIASFESNSGYADGIVSVYDAQTHDVEWQSEGKMFDGYAWTGIHDVKVGDVDQDGNQEILVGTDRLYDGVIYVIDGKTHAKKHSYFYDGGAPIYSLSIADLDMDGKTEIIAGGGRELTGAPGVYVYVINGSTGAVKWHSVSLGAAWSEIYNLETGDIDGDGTLEIVATNGSIFVFDGITHQMWQSSLTGCAGLDLCDINKDGIKEILVGTDNGRIIALEGQNYREVLNLQASSGSIKGLRGHDLVGDGDIEIISGSEGCLNLYSIQASILVCQRKKLGFSAGDYHSLFVSDIDSDFRVEVLIGTNHMVCEFEGPYIAPVTHVEKEGHSSKLGNFILFQNYPNPFNPITRIDYILPRSGKVKLTIYNLKGQLVKTLLDKSQSSGNYSVEWDTEGLSSGIYFYKIEFDNSAQVRKCILLK